MEEGKGIVITAILFVIGLVMTIIIGFTIITNLYPIQEELATSTTLVDIINESGWLNSTTYTLDDASVIGFTSPAIVVIINATDNAIISADNYSLSSAGVLSNTTYGWYDVKISYYYGIKETTASVEQLRSNLTSGIGSVSNKLPTIFLLAVIIIVLAILMILWAYYKNMNFSGGGGSSSSGGTVSGEL